MYFKKSKHYFFLLSVCLVIGVSSCKKDLVADHTTTTSPDKKKVDNILPPPLTWTDQTYPWGSTQVLSPFAGGTSREFPTEYLSDINPNDGWELYLNTFTSGTPIDQKKYFVIYNRYRGLLRIYYYLDNSNFSPTKNIVWELGLNGTKNNSNILNFEQGELVDNPNRLLYTTRVQLQKKVQPNGCWYAEQFQLAYDDALYSDPNSNDYKYNSFKLGFYAQNVTTYSFNGTQSGTLDGTIQVPQSTSSGFFSTLINGALSIGQSALSAGASTVLGAVFKDGLSKLKFSQVADSALKDIKTSSTVKSLPKSLFNAILGKSSSGTNYSSEKVELKLNTTIKLDGTGTDSPTGLGTFTALISATQNLNSNESGIIPRYQKKLGVFNISGTPVVLTSISKAREEVGSTTNVTYELDQSSFSIVWNNDLVNSDASGATIQNLKKEYILIDAKSPVSGTGYSQEYITPSDVTYNAYTSSGVIAFSRKFQGPPTNWSPAVTGYALRITFDVVPNNGSGRYTIIKSFKASNVTTILN